jgi:esterase
LINSYPVRLNFQAYGAGFPLVILHGLFGSLDNWRTLSHRLGDCYRVFVFDLRNHGGSPHSEVMNYEVMVEDVHEFLQIEGIPQAYVLGHSLGGKVAMGLALQHAVRVAKLIVVDMAPRGYAPWHRPILTALRGLDLAAFGSRNEMDAALAGAIPEPAVRQFLLKNVGRDETGAWAWKMNLQAIDANYERLIGPINAGRPYRGSALFIRGGKSDYVQDLDREFILRLFPRAKISTIVDAGHWVQVEAPEALLAAVDAFLREE